MMMFEFHNENKTKHFHYFIRILVFIFKDLKAQNTFITTEGLTWVPQTSTGTVLCNTVRTSSIFSNIYCDAQK